MKYSYANETHYRKKGFALSLGLKMRVFGTRKLSVCLLFPSNSVSRSNLVRVHTAENIRDQNTQLFYFRNFF